jgi:hypothetical protein
MLWQWLTCIVCRSVLLVAKHLFSTLPPLLAPSTYLLFACGGALLHVCNELLLGNTQAFIALLYALT